MTRRGCSEIFLFCFCAGLWTPVAPQTAGGGSASVTSSGTVTPLQGITAAAPPGVTVRYNWNASSSNRATAAGNYGIEVGDSDANLPLSGKCLDDTGFSVIPGTQVQIWSCTGNANQSWTQP
jgi:Ricin-type beta-trefoil lectin domain-like